MKRIGMFVGLGALILGSALPAFAQAPPTTTVSSGNVNVTFGGQMRVYGFAFDNTSDFKNTINAPPGSPALIHPQNPCNAANCKDSADFFFQRFRLFTTMESADHQAGAYWALEIGDIVWGQAGGASGSEFNACGKAVSGGGPSTNVTTRPCAFSGGNRTGNGAGGALGADGVNVETKNIYLWFNIPGLSGAKLLAGIHRVAFLESPTGGFFDDDAPGLQLSWKADPFDLILEWARFTDQSVVDSQHNDAYIARFGANVTPDFRVTLETMVMNEQCLANEFVTTPAGSTQTGPCIQTGIGDSFWVGDIAQGKIGDITLGGGWVYGQRELAGCATCSQKKFRESGFGFELWSTIPVGPITVYPEGWYTTGDKNRPILAGVQQTSNAVLTRNSDRLAVPEAGASWGNVAPFVAEWLFGLNTIGAPEVGGSVDYLDRAGTWGVGSSALYAVTPSFTAGAGVAFAGASDSGARCPITPTPTCPAGATNVYGDAAFEIDPGFIYKLNANMTITGIGGYIVPDKGDNAWGIAVRSQFAF